MRGKIVDPRTGHTKEVDKRVGAASAKDAAGIRDELLKEALSPAAAERVKVVDFSKSWIESKAGVVSRYTLEGYTYALDQHVVPAIGAFYYDAVGHLDVQAMVNRWLGARKPDGEPYARRSIQDWFWVFRNMTRDAMIQLGLDRDPTLRISFGEDSPVEEAIVIDDKLTAAECHLLLDGMRRKRPASWALLRTKKYTGQRFCHVSALKWSDIDWANMVIHFRRKQVRGVVGPISRRKPVPKEIPMLRELAFVLIEHGRRLGKLEYPVGLDFWVFPSRRRTLKQPSSLVNAIKRTAKEIGLKKRITPHRMRYFFNDVLREAGVDQVTRKSLTGHVTDEMTEHYSTVRLDEKRAAMEAVASKLRAVEVGTRVGTGGENEKAA